MYEILLAPKAKVPRLSDIVSCITVNVKVNLVLFERSHVTGSFQLAMGFVHKTSFSRFISKIHKNELKLVHIPKCKS